MIKITSVDEAKSLYFNRFGIIGFSILGKENDNQEENYLEGLDLNLLESIRLVSSSHKCMKDFTILSYDSEQMKSFSLAIEKYFSSTNGVLNINVTTKIFKHIKKDFKKMGLSALLEEVLSDDETKLDFLESFEYVP